MSPGDELSRYEYTYDILGNQLSKTEIKDGAEYVTSYTYDDISRLTSETMPDSTVATYTFDNQNNISTKDISHPEGFTYSFVQDEENYSIGNINTHRFTYAYDANNRLMTERETLTGTSDNYSGAVEVVKSYTYDANGNMLSKKSGGQIDEEVVKYTYDSWNRLSQFEDAQGNTYQYAYNGNNERVSKTSNGETTKFYWDRGYISNESTDNILSTSNAIGVQGIFARTKDNNEEYLLKDGHGSVTDILSNGTVTDEFEYDAYGNQKTNTTSDTPFRYCGEYQDLCSGLIYLRNRYYDPSIGRFITEDPARDGLNWYVYCGNNPIRYKDPSGLVITCDEANSGRIISLLREVSGNSLEFEYKDGQINITKTYDTKHHVGQTLVSDLINLSETVNVNIGVDSSGNTNTEWPANGGDSMQIFIDPDDTTGNGLFTTYTQDTDGNVLEEVIPAYIVFGHELIHSWRDIRGLDVPSREMVGLIPQDSPQLWREEELQTMGINYTDAAGNPLRNYGSYVGIISENGLRLENGLNVRISYYGW